MATRQSLSLTEVAERLGVHPRTVYRAVSADGTIDLGHGVTLPVLKVGRLLRVPTRAVDELLGPRQDVVA